MSRATQTLITDLATGETLALTLTLLVVAGPDRGKRVALRTGTLVLGAGSDVDVSLTDPRVSRRHATVELVPDGVRVRDLKSRNGTRVNGAAITDTVARPGAVLEIGDTTFVLDGEGAPVDLGRPSGTLGPLKAQGASMRRLYALLERAAKSDVTVLLQGESGTGKDVVARALHAASARKKGPFRVVDCAAIAPGLVASELFGHRRGAFTSAHEDRVGAFEAANGGTLFLDEIGELPLDLQPALLRVLELRHVTRVGETQVRPVDVRIVAATNRNLRFEVDHARFRADLYFRLAVVSVALPPLRERKDEVLALAAHFLREQGRSLDDVVPADRQRLLAHPWPGNVRELRNAILRACALTDLNEPVQLVLDEPEGRIADAAALPSSPDVAELLELPLPEARRRLLDSFDGRYLDAVLAACGGNVSAAARRAGVARSYFHRLLRKHAPGRARRPSR